MAAAIAIAADASRMNVGRSRYRSIAMSPSNPKRVASRSKRSESHTAVETPAGWATKPRATSAATPADIRSRRNSEQSSNPLATCTAMPSAWCAGADSPSTPALAHQESIATGRKK
jgi:hypothetical protein